MKRHLISTVLLTSLLCNSPLLAEEAAPVTEPPAKPSRSNQLLYDNDMHPSDTPVPQSAWNEYGIIDMGVVSRLLGIKPTPEQWGAIAGAVQERNWALAAANAKFSAELQKALGTSDAELAAKMAEEKERRRMELMRIRQPSRYQALKNKKK